MQFAASNAALLQRAVLHFLGPHDLSAHGLQGTPQGFRAPLDWCASGQHGLLLPAHRIAAQESYLEVNTAYRVLSPLLLSVWFMVEVRKCVGAFFGACCVPPLCLGGPTMCSKLEIHVVSHFTQMWADVSPAAPPVLRLRRQFARKGPAAHGLLAFHSDSPGRVHVYNAQPPFALNTVNSAARPHADTEPLPLSPTDPPLAFASLALCPGPGSCDASCPSRSSSLLRCRSASTARPSSFLLSVPGPSSSCALSSQVRVCTPLPRLSFPSPSIPPFPLPFAPVPCFRAPLPFGLGLRVSLLPSSHNIYSPQCVRYPLFTAQPTSFEPRILPFFPLAHGLS
jgi:hypothetical protein